MSNVTYQNQDLLVSGAVSASSRRFANDSVGGWGKEGVRWGGGE